MLEVQVSEAAHISHVRRKVHQRVVLQLKNLLMGPYIMSTRDDISKRMTATFAFCYKAKAHYHLAI